jgi:type IV pilus assembly protein PilC
VVVARFSRTLSTLLKSGVSILVALEISSKTSGNRIVEVALDKVTSRVSKGEKIAESLMESKLFAPLVVSLVAVGEETGDISSMLDKIAYFYEDEVDVAVGNLTSLIEPFIIVFLGVLIGGIVLSIFLPILQLTQVMGR